MSSQITIYEIIDSKKTKPKYLFYPSASCLSPYLDDNNYSNINIIKQRKEIEKIKGNKNFNKRNEGNILYENKTDSNLGKYHFNYKIDSESINKEDFMENKFSKKYWNFNKSNEEKLKNIPNKEFNTLKNNNINNIIKKKEQNIEKNILNNDLELENMNKPFIDNILKNKNAKLEKDNKNNVNDLQNKIINKNELNNFNNNINNKNENKLIFSEKNNIPIIKDDKIEDNNNDYLNIIIPQKEVFY